ncbi:unnamed protein product, partial [Heterosigma akashiwo]
VEGGTVGGRRQHVANGSAPPANRLMLQALLRAWLSEQATRNKHKKKSLMSSSSVMILSLWRQNVMFFSFKSNNLSTRFQGRLLSFYKQTLPPLSAISQYHYPIIVKSQAQIPSVPPKLHMLHWTPVLSPQVMSSIYILRGTSI